MCASSTSIGIFAELEWCAKHNLDTVGIADANFGIFERDVAIAEKIAELKAIYGYPKFVGNNYAKNTVKHLSKIIEIFTEAGIVAEGKMSMQTFDEGTLTTIRRKNIKVEKYYDLSGEFRRNNLPMMVDIMMGLPGSTPETFRNDLQECINRTVRVAIHSTILLTNSPDERAGVSRGEQDHGLGRARRSRKRLRSPSAEWEQMNRLTAAYYVFENFGVLRQVATYVHAETGTREIDFYERLVEDVHAEPERWPLTMLTLAGPAGADGAARELAPAPRRGARLPRATTRPDRRRRTRHGDGGAARAAAGPRPLLPGGPTGSRTTTARGSPSWPTYATAACTVTGTSTYGRLRDFEPGTFTVNDPFDVCTTALGGSLRSLMVENAWDLESSVSRPRQRLNDDDHLAGIGGQ